MRKLATLALVLALVIGGVLIALALPANAAPALACPTGWGSTPEAVATMSPSPIVSVRAGRHECFDRVVVEVAGTAANGWSAQYVVTVTEDGSGRPVTVPGGARIALVLHNPAGSLRMPAVVGYTTLRSVVYAGSFEGYTTLGVGTRARLPFRVFALAGPAGHSRIVLDVAHRW